MMNRSVSRRRSNNFRNPKIIARTPKEPVAVYIPASIIKTIFGLAIFAGLVYLVLLSGYFKVRIIEIVGKAPVEVADALEQEKGKNILFINNQRLERSLREVYPGLATVVIYRGLPDTLKLVFQERKAVLIWRSKEKKYYVDKQGIVFQEISESEGNYPIVADLHNIPVKLGQKILPDRFIDFVEYMQENFEKESGLKIVNFEVNETTLHVGVVTDLGWKVLLDTGRLPEDQLADLKTIIAKHKNDVHEYVDLRVPGYGYYK